jgi:hypothetical protein
MSTISDHFQKVQEVLLAQAKQAGIFGADRADMGTAREKFVEVFLRYHLPHICPIGSGIVIDFKDTKSKQMDLVIYSATFPKMIVAEKGVFLRESVISTIEVKSFLDKNQLELALSSVDSFKNLKIASPEYVPLLVNIDDSKFQMEANPASYIFAYDGLELATIVNHANQFYVEQHTPQILNHGVDIICILNKGIVIKNDGHLFPKVKDAGYVVAYEVPGDALLILFIHILNTISHFGLIPYNFAQYLSFSDLSRITNSRAV